MLSVHAIHLVKLTYSNYSQFPNQQHNQNNIILFLFFVQLHINLMSIRSTSSLIFKTNNYTILENKD